MYQLETVESSIECTSDARDFSAIGKSPHHVFGGEFDSDPSSAVVPMGSLVKIVPFIDSALLPFRENRSFKVVTCNPGSGCEPNLDVTRLNLG
jgi:hypothetical protein